MQPWTVRRKLFAGLASIVFVYGVSIWLVLLGASSIEQRLRDSREVGARRLAAVVDLGRSFEVMFSGEKSQILAAWSNNQQNYDRWVGKVADAAAETAATIDTLAALSRSTSERQAAERLGTLLKDWLRLHEDVIRTIASQDYLAAQTLSTKQGIPIKEGTRKELAALVAQEDAALDAHVNGARAEYARSWRIAMVAVLIGVVLAGGWGLAIRRICRTLGTLTSEMQDRARHVLVAASEVAGSAQSLSNGAVRQASAVEETSTAMRDMAVMTRRNAEHSEMAAGLMTEVQQRVGDSNQALETMMASMNAIRESSARVSKIIKTIDEVAFQTNILALNASVEAARAGEAGMGFAVVADEVRSLAQRSAEAARNTGVLIEESIATTQAGTRNVVLVADSVGSITESVERTKKLIDDVSSATGQQSHGIDHVMRAIAEMEKIAQNTAATAQQNAAAGEELTTHTQQSLDTVARIETMIGGVSDARGASAAQPTSSVFRPQPLTGSTR
jgi:methyl-accepting chemotaxis protein/methyl-accepting chemotaxis protein-1 (serine sensor receptor)